MTFLSAEKLNYSGRQMHAEKEQQQDPLVGRVNAAQFLAPNKTIQDYQESVLSGRSFQPVCSTQAMKCPTTQAYPGIVYLLMVMPLDAYRGTLGGET